MNYNTSLSQCNTSGIQVSLPSFPVTTTSTLIAQYGFKKGALIEQIYYWTVERKTLFLKGHYWYRASRRALMLKIPGLSFCTLGRMVADLRKKKVIFTARLRASYEDQTLYYRLNLEEVGQYFDQNPPSDSSPDKVDTLTQENNEVATQNDNSNTLTVSTSTLYNYCLYKTKRARAEKRPGTFVFNILNKLKIAPWVWEEVQRRANALGFADTRFLLAQLGRLGLDYINAAMSKVEGIRGIRNPGGWLRNLLRPDKPVSKKPTNITPTELAAETTQPLFTQVRSEDNDTQLCKWLITNFNEGYFCQGLLTHLAKLKKTLDWFREIITRRGILAHLGSISKFLLDEITNLGGRLDSCNLAFTWT